MPEPTTPHRRRTPCCEIEAYRYLAEHDYEWAVERAELARRTEAAEQALADLRTRVEGLERDEQTRFLDDEGDGYGGIPFVPVSLLRALLAVPEPPRATPEEPK